MPALDNLLGLTTEVPLGAALGPQPARVLIVGEAWGQNEEREGKPFVGASGQELTNMLHEANILRSDCRITNVVNARPERNDIENWFHSSKTKAKAAGEDTPLFRRYPHAIVRRGIEALKHEIETTHPSLIIAFGNTALWALTGEVGITKWRGSYLHATGPVDAPSVPVLPTYHPAAVLRQWSWRYIAVHDIRYAASILGGTVVVPEWDFTLSPSFSTATLYLNNVLRSLEKGPTRVAADVETRRGQISCIGLGLSDRRAICIPFHSNKTTDGNYWTNPAHETALVLQLRRILTHSSAEVIFQNGLYDIQYILDNWKFLPHITHDTMVLQHACWPGLPKGLDFLASMYCSYRRYWKDDGKEWSDKYESEEDNWRYNCLDCVRTWEIVDPLLSTLKYLNVEHVYAQLCSEFEPVLFMMINGVSIDAARRGQMTLDLIEMNNVLQSWFDTAVESGFNPRSAHPNGDMQRLFYHELRIKPVTHRKTGRATLAKGALDTVLDRQPLLHPLILRIKAYRTAGTFKANFIDAPLDPDGRIRCSYNPCGTETDRFSSSANAFGRGTNLENIPRPPETGERAPTPIVTLPNVRSIFIPDPGYIIADFDLDRADAHIVAWESGDESLKRMFLAGVDIHEENAKVIGTGRQLAKSFVHGTNYGGGEKTVAGHCGISVAQARNGQRLWFNAHPRIKEWHERVERQLMQNRTITTVFGRKRMYFDRISAEIRNQALAYIGQSPVAWVINRGLRRVYDELPWCQLLLQNHDSIVVQFPNDNVAERINDITQRLRVSIPYPDPLIIPVGCKYSTRSWGELRPA